MMMRLIFAAKSINLIKHKSLITKYYLVNGW